jgi:hypothetical protein
MFMLQFRDNVKNAGKKIREFTKDAKSDPGIVLPLFFSDLQLFDALSITSLEPFSSLLPPMIQG